MAPRTYDAPPWGARAASPTKPRKYPPEKYYRSVRCAGLRLYGYDDDADELKATSLRVVRGYYEKWGTVFEFYDALNTTDPTQTLRKPPHRDVGKCLDPAPPGMSVQ